MLEIHWYENKSYHESCNLQNYFARSVKFRYSGIVLGFNYLDPVVTLGIRACERDILDRKTLEAHEFDVCATDRGGCTTIHSPGQMVIYPILPLKAWKLGVKNYIDLLMEATSTWLSLYDIEVIRCKKGVFTERGKLAFIGVAVRQGVSLHGLSINVANDLRLFSLINPCGVSDLRVDSMCGYPKVGERVELEPLFKEWCRSFEQLLGDYQNCSERFQTAQLEC